MRYIQRYIFECDRSFSHPTFGRVDVRSRYCSTPYYSTPQLLFGVFLPSCMRSGLDHVLNRQRSVFIGYSGETMGGSARATCTGATVSPNPFGQVGGKVHGVLADTELPAIVSSCYSIQGRLWKLFMHWLTNVIFSYRLSIVYNVFSDTFKSGLGVSGPALAILVASMPVIYITLCGIFWALSKSLLPGLDPSTRAAALFCSSQKTLAFGKCRWHSASKYLFYHTLILI